MELVTKQLTSPLIDNDTIKGQVEALLAQLHPGVIVERRRQVRVAAPVLFRLTPLDEDRQLVSDQSIVVVGKNISQRGISFIHNRPLPYRRARLTLIQPGMGTFDAEMDISWCRFTRPGWYESGGRLLRAANRFWPGDHLDLASDDA
jgi:hypothetical protein